jgi:hypothetical protein
MVAAWREAWSASVSWIAACAHALRKALIVCDLVD